MKRKYFKTLAVVIGSFIACFADIRAQQPSYNYAQHLPSGTDIHPIDSDPYDDGWIKVFEEKFDIDADYPNFSSYTTKWSINDKLVESNLDVINFVFKPQNVRMNGGKCYLTSKKELTYWQPTDEFFWYSSGGIESVIDKSNNMGEWETGMFEARIAMSSAYWAHDNMWIFAAHQGEIDACEIDPGLKWLKYKVPHHIHRTNDVVSYSDNGYTLIFPSVQKFHTYTVIWDKYFIYLIVDHNVWNKKVFAKLEDVNGNDILSNIQLALSGDYKLQNHFMPINQSGIVILDQAVWDKGDKGTGFEKAFVKQDAGMPGSTIIDWIKIYKRNPCNQTHKITASRLFPYNNLDEEILVLGDNAIGNSLNESWQTVVPDWGGGKYTAEGITLVDNFEFYPTVHLYSSQTPSQPTTYFEFVAKDCSELKDINEYEQPEHKEITPEEDTTDVEDTLTCSEYLDYVAIDSAIDSAILTNDTIFLTEIYAFLDSLGCPYEMEDSNSNFSARMSRVEEEIGKKDPETLAAISRLRVYPNPNNGSFLIATNGKGTYEIQVVNILGVVVYKGSLTDEQRKSIKLDDALPPGTYTIHINGPGINHIEKLTIIK